MMKTFNIQTLGCKVNQYESEAIAEKFLERGFEKSDDLADIYVINTCSVTNMSDRKSRQMISKARRKNPEAIIAVIGCYSQVKPEEIEKIKGVDIILGSRNKKDVVNLCEEYLNERTDCYREVIAYNKHDKIEDLSIKNQSEMTRAYMKIQDGCNMYCTYCIIPYARGPVTSRNIDSIIKEAKDLVENGYKEIILTGIHVSSYGKDFKEDIGLIDVIERLSKLEGLNRIRLSSMEAGLIDDEFLKRLKNTKICDHFHLSLQSGSDTILKKMNRRYDTEKYFEKVKLIRKYFDNVALTTDVIVGFPYESEKLFEETLEFVKKVHFSKIHIFKYSKRDGTKASMMDCQVDENTKKMRAQKLDLLEKELSEEYKKSQVGKKLEVLFEKKHQDDLYQEGYSSNYQRVKVQCEDDLTNTVREVKIFDFDKDALIGKLV